MDGGFWLWVSHVCQGESEDYATLAIVVQRAQFRLRRGGNNKTKNCSVDMKSPIQLNGFVVARHPSNEEMAACASEWMFKTMSEAW